MQKRILSVLLVFAMVLSFVPVTVVAAAGTVAASDKAGTHTDAGHSDDCGLTSGWTEWTDATSLPAQGQIVLNTNVQLPGEIVLTGDLTICLNGYVITAAANCRLFSVITADTKLVITDCTAYEENGVYHAGALTGGTDTTKDGGGCVLVGCGSSMKLYDGRITGNTHKSDSNGGGAIMLQAADSSNAGGKFYMYGGQISDNQALKKNGSVGTHGGAIYANTGATVEITGGTLSGNIATRGGVVYAVQDSNVTIKHAELTDNEGSTGGAICAYNNADVRLEDVTIQGNTGKNGGAIYAQNSALVSLKDCTITGNTGTGTNIAAGYSAAIYMCGNANKLTVSGKTVIADNTTVDPSVPDICMNNATGDILYINDLAEGSRMVFATRKTVPTDAKEVMGLNTQQTEPWQSGWVRWMDAEGNLKDVGLVNEEFVWGHYHGDKAFTALTSADQLTATGNYYLASDVKLDKEATVSAAADVTLCLNGHDLTPADGARVLHTDGHSVKLNLTIDDCTAYTDSKGVYHAGAITGASHTNTGGVFSLQGSSHLILEDGKISGNQGSSGGAIILWGAMTMNGGEISNNKAGASSDKNGGGIYLNNRSTIAFTMNGGTIKGNSAARGGGIYHNCPAGTPFVLNGGTITGNTATLMGGGVYIAAASTSKLSGKLNITGNTCGDKASNVYMLSTSVLQPENLDKESRIGITLHTDRIAAGVMYFTTELAADPGNFVSDDSTYKVELVDKKLTLVDNTVAPPAVHKHNGCNDTSCTDHAQIEYQAWTDANALPTEGSWYLDTDVTVSAAIDLTKSVDICLNGHTIRPATGSSTRMYTAAKDAGIKLTIADCTAETKNSVYTAGKITGFAGTKQGAVLEIMAGNTFELFDGMITGNTNTASGGALFINCVFNMYGGEFSGNTAGKEGAWKNGGAIYLNKDSLATVTGGTFKNNAAKEGGAVYMGRDNAHTFENVTFVGNKADQHSGALSIGVGMSLGVTLKNCTFENNTASSYGGTIRVAGVTRLEGCTITGSQGDKGAVYVYTGAELTLAGNNQITGNESNLYLVAQEVIKVENATGTVGVSAEIPGRAFTEACDDYTANFVSDNTDYKVTYKDGKLWLEPSFAHKHCVCGDATCTAHEQVDFLPWEQADTLPASGNYCLLTDVTVSARHLVESDLTLCLHGHTITTTTQNRLISTSGAVTLTITDCTAKTVDGVYTAGKLTGGTDAAKVGGGALFVGKGCVLKLYEGIITGNKTQCDGAGGGAVMLQSGTQDNYASFYMYGGEISGNQACSADGTPDRLGGGIYAYANAVFVMESGTIKNNEAGNGGGIYANNARLTITGGTIEGNTATIAGGGIATENSTTIKLSGAVTIMGNTADDKASNLCLDGDQKIKVGTLDQNAKVGVSGQPLRYITESCADYTANFLSDNAKYQIVYKDGAIYLDAAGNHKHCFCAGITTKCDHTVQTYVEWDDPTSLPNSGNYYLSVDVKVDAQVYMYSTELNLCLNGHKITITNNRAYNIKGNSVLRISDCAEKPGTITGAKNGAIITESDTEAKSLIELYNGTFSGNENASMGGAILIQGGTTFNMYGGKITGNALHCKLQLDENSKPVLDEKGNQTVTSTRGGGGLGLYGENTTFNMYGGQITRNKTTKAVYLSNGVETNGGGYGGGIYSYKGSIYIYGGEISKNTTDRTGGGLFIQGPATMELHGGKITGNSCAASGGGFYLSGACVFKMTGGEISGNKAKNAGGFHCNSSVKATITGGSVSKNSSTSSGGGIVLSGKNVVMTMSGGEISGNKASGSAGGVLAQSGATLKLTDSNITGNTAKASGGGIYISYNSFLTINGGSVKNNKATKDAGGVMLVRCEASISNCSISNNSTGVSGGGIRVSGSKLTASGLTMVGNTAKKHAGAIITGSATSTTNGVKTVHNVNCNLYGCYFGSNTAGSSGGAMLIQSTGTQFHVKNSTFADNKATSSGGAVYASKNVTVSFEDCKVTGNTAGGSGGAIRLTACTSELINVLIENNTGKSAGGLYMNGANNKLTAKNVQILNNNADGGSGGGVYAGGGTYTTDAEAVFIDCVIRGNTCTNSGGAINLTSVMNVTMENVDMSENSSGVYAGGVYLGAGSRATMNNVRICDNKTEGNGGGITNGGVFRITESVISGNTADENGGGVYTYKSAHRLTQDEAGIYITDCQISDNTSGNQGGGIYNYVGGPAYLNNVTITGNKSAQEGSGILSAGILEMTDVTIENNTAPDNKYAFYVTPGNCDGHSYYSGRKTIAGNVIVRNNNGGDMYMDQGSVAVIPTTTLGDKAIIHLTLSDGVLTQRVIGTYHYEGEDLTYTLTAGDRSITEPMAPEGMQKVQEDTAAGDNILLYVGVGVFTLAVIALVVLLLMKKKKAGKPAEEANKE